MGGHIIKRFLFLMVFCCVVVCDCDVFAIEFLDTKVDIIRWYYPKPDSELLTTTILNIFT